MMLSRILRQQVRKAALGAVLLFLVGLASLTPTHAAINKQVNFQGRLTDANGNVVADGTYNIEFKLHSSSGGSGGGQGTCSGDCLWLETRTGGNVVTVSKGLFSIQLGEVTSLGSFNFNQDPLYLSVRVGGSGTPSWDTEMSPRHRLGAAPQAIFADSAGNSTTVGGYTPGNGSGNIPISNGTLSTNLNADLLDGQHGSFFQNGSNINSGTVGDAYLSSNIALLGGRSGGQTINGDTAASGALTLSSTVNATKGKIYLGANSAYDEANQRLGIGTASPGYVIDTLTGATARLGNALVGEWPGAAGSGYAMFGNQAVNASGATAYALIQDSGGATFLNAANTKNVAIRNANNNVAYFNANGQDLQVNGGKTTLQLSSTGSNTGLTIGADTNLYRASANVLQTDDLFQASGSIEANKGTGAEILLNTDGKIYLGSSYDTNLYRNTGGNFLKSDDRFASASYVEANHGGANLVTIGYNGTVAAPSLTFGTSYDTNLYRSTTDTLKTDDNLIVNLTADINGSAAIGNQASVTADVGLQLSQLNTLTSGTGYGVNARGWTAPGSASSASTYGGAFQGLVDSSTSSNVTGNLYGISGNAAHNGTGTLSTAYGTFSQVDKGSTGPLTTAYGLYSNIRNTNATGAITNAYGLYIADSTETGVITNDYGVYQVDTGAYNFFGGNVGIGTNAPANAKLQFSTGTTEADGIAFGTASDRANLYRSGADALKTDDQLVVGGGSTSAGVLASNNIFARNGLASQVNIGDNGPSGAAAIVFGNAGDSANLYRSAADTLKTDDNFIVGSDKLNVSVAGNYVYTTAAYFEATSTGKAAIRLSSTASDTGITLGGDTNLYRPSATADTLKTDDTFNVAGGAGSKTAFQISSTTANTGLTIGGDTNLYRSAADTLKSDDTFDALAYKVNGTAGASATCSAGQVYDAQVVSGGIVTSGTCGATGAAATLQSAYNATSGNTLTTTNARDLSITLADTATDSNFVVNRASGSTSVSKFQDNSTDVLSIGTDTTINRNLLANSAATGTTGSTAASGAASNTTTVTLSAAGSFANNDVILIANTTAVPYYTRIVSGGGTTTLTVDPPVTWENSKTVTKYTVQNIGATTSSYTTASTRPFEIQALGQVKVGSNSTKLSDGRLDFQGDTNLYRTAADTLKTDDALRVGTSAAAGIAGDLSISRNSSTTEGYAYFGSAGSYFGYNGSQFTANSNLNLGGNTLTLGAGNSQINFNAGTEYIYWGSGASAHIFSKDIGVGFGSGTAGRGCIFNNSFSILGGTCASDQNLKKDIKDADSVFDRFGQLRVVNYRLRPEKNPGASDQVVHTGVIAQEVEKIFPELVITDEKGVKRVDYSTLELYNLNATNELVNRVKELELQGASADASTVLSTEARTIKELKVAEKAVVATLVVENELVLPEDRKGANVQVKKGDRKFEVKFKRPQENDAYTVQLTPSWITAYGVTTKTKDGFTIEFDKKAPKDAKLDWTSVR